MVSYISPTFGVADYIVFALFLLISSAIGIFFSWRGQNTTGEYFLGNRQMHPIPVGLSTGMSFLSSTMIVGMSAEIYVNGYQYAFSPILGSFGFFLGSILIAYVLFPLNMTSIQEYFDRRYNSRAVTIGANILVLICIFEYMGVCMLGSVIAFNSVTGGQISVVTGLIIGGSIGIFYTSIGGLKAVVWTDVLQSILMLLGVLIVIGKSIIDIPDDVSVLEVNKRYLRIHPTDWSFDPTIRHTMWGILVGTFFSWSVWASQPANVQRLCATSGFRAAVMIAGIAASIFVIFSLLPGWAGLNIFAYYISKGCDIYAAGWIKENEIILYYIRERLNWPGFQGLFMASLYAGSLSSLSSGLNSASAILWRDLLKVYVFPNVTETKATLISKLLVVIFGFISMVWCYILYSFGGLILQVASSIDAAIYSTYFTVFVIAVTFRFVQWKGALAGMIVGLVVTEILGVGSLLHRKVQKVDLPTLTDQCEWGNSTFPNMTTEAPGPFNQTQKINKTIFDISYTWLSLICVIITVIFAMLVSLCTGRAKHVPDELFVPISRRHYIRHTIRYGGEKGKQRKEKRKAKGKKSNKATEDGNQDLDEVERVPLQEVPPASQDQTANP